MTNKLEISKFYLVKQVQLRELSKKVLMKVNKKKLLKRNLT